MTKPSEALDNSKIRIGISSCLLGNKVRFNGGHKQDRYITDTLGEYFEWQIVCPEAEVGLGTPRPTIHLTNSPEGVRVLQSKSDLDLTEKMETYSQKKVNQLSKTQLYGFILKSKSPSCGLLKVKVHNGKGKSPNTNGVGVFAKELKEKFPTLPIEEEGRLNNPKFRENWIKRVFTFYRFHNTVYPRPTVGKLVKFHSENKFAILCHCEKSYKSLGNLVANHEGLAPGDLARKYEVILMEALEKHTTPSKHMNVLLHMFGFLKNLISAEAKQDILETFDTYKKGHLPLTVPIALLHHYVKLHKVNYLLNQTYLMPHPKELSLLY